MKSGISTSTDYTQLRGLLTLFLRCVSLFEDINDEYVNRSVHEVHSILEKRMRFTRKNPFSSTTNWTRSNGAESEIKVTMTLFGNTMTSTYVL